MTNAVIRNLLINTEKFSKVDGKIELNAQVIQNKVWISINDNGVGMTPKKVTKLFTLDKVISTEGTPRKQGSICLGINYGIGFSKTTRW